MLIINLQFISIYKSPVSGSLQGDFAVDGPETSLPKFKSMVVMLSSSQRSGPLVPLMKNMKIKLVDGVSFDIEPVF